MQRSIKASVRAGSVAAWLVATFLVALSPVLYFIAGASDAATEGARVMSAAVPLVFAWVALSIGFVLIQRRRAAPVGLSVGAPARRAAGLLAVALVMLAVARSLALHSSIEGDGTWALYWLACAAVWTALCWMSARSLARRTR